MENSFCSSLEAICSKETTDAIETALKNCNIKPEMVNGIFKSLTDENDWGIITVDGERIRLKIEDLSDPNKLVADMAIFMYKANHAIIEGIKNQIDGLYLEAHIDRYGELLGQQEVLLKCLKRKNTSKRIIEKELNSLIEKTQVVLMEIQDKTADVVRVYHRGILEAIQERNVDKYENKEKMTEESVFLYFESIDTIVWGLLYLGELDEACKFVSESKKTINDLFTDDVIVCMKDYSDNLSNKEGLWDKYIYKEKEYLAALEDRFLSGKFEVCMERYI